MSKRLCSILTLALLCFLAGNAAAAPSFFYVGTWAIDVYTGSGCTNLNDEIAMAESLWVATQNYADDSYLYHMEDRTDDSVYLAAVGDNSMREQCDFAFFGGHGDLRMPIYVHTNDHTSWIGVPLSEQEYGTDYLRWWWSNGCDVFAWYGDMIAEWNGMFEGLQVAMGYASHGWDIYYARRAPSRFWQYWTGSDGYSELSMWSAFREAIGDRVYDDGGYGIEPAAITARSSSYHIYWTDTYDDATNEQGHDAAFAYNSYVFGTPSYSY